MSEKKKTKAKTGSQVIKLKREIIDNSVLDFDFFDHVEVTSYQRGMLFSFGKGNPQEGKIIISKQLLLPFDIAGSMKDIIIKQFENLVENKFLTENYKVIENDETTE